MTGRILWIHGMGEKPPPERELARTWRAMSEALWVDVPADAYIDVMCEAHGADRLSDP